MQILHHIWRPVVVDLETAHLYAAVMDIDPVVRNDVADGFNFGPVDQIQLRDQDAEGHIVTVRKSCGDCGFPFRNVVHAADQILDGHGGNENISGFFIFLPVLLIGEAGEMVLFVPVQAHHAAVFQNPAAHFLNFGSGYIPKLAGTKLGIAELLDEGGFHMPGFFAGEKLAEHVRNDRHDGEPLYALRTPVGIDFRRASAPEIFRIFLKKHGVELPAETVYIEILQRVFLSFMYDAYQIAEAGLEGRDQAHVFKGFPFQGDRIVKKFPVKINPGYPVSGEHDPVRLFRIRAAGGKRRRALKDNVVISGRALQREHIVPPFVHLRIFGKKAVASHIHSVAIMFYCF